MNFTLSAGVRVISLHTNSVNFIHKNDRWSVIFCDPEKFPNELGTITEVFLDKFGTDDAEESGRGLISYGFGKEGLSGSRRTVQNNSLRRLDTHFFVVLGMRQWELDRFLERWLFQIGSCAGYLDLCNLLVQTTNIRVGLCWSLFQLHD